MKRTYQPSNLVRKEDMVLEQGWLQKLVGSLSHVDGLKEEKLFLLKNRWLSLKV